MPETMRKATLFVALTYFFSFLLVYGYLALGGNWATGLSFIPILYMFIPMIMAIVVQKVIYKEPIKGPLGISFKFNRWFLVAWLLPPVIAFLTLGISLLMPGVEYSPGMEGFIQRFQATLTPEQLEQLRTQTSNLPVHPIWLALIEGLVAGITVNAVAGFGEELGWRGFLLKQTGGVGFWRSSVIIGVIWGVWHAPIILQGYNYPEHPVLGVAMMTVFTLLLSPIFSYVRIKARSVIAAAIIHGALNGTFGIPIMVIQGGNDLTVGGTGLAGFIALALANIALVVFDRFWAKEPIMWKRAEPVGGAVA